MMKERYKETIARAKEAQSQLSKDHPKYQKFARKLDGIVWATSYVKRLIIFSCVFFVLFGAAFQYLMYPDFMMMAIFVGVGVGGALFCWAVGVVQLKLYGRTINKIRSSC